MEHYSAYEMVNKYKKQRNVSFAIVGVFGVVLVTLSAKILIHRETMIFMPTSINEEFTLRGGKVSPVYINKLAREVIEKFLNESSSPHHLWSPLINHKQTSRI